MTKLSIKEQASAANALIGWFNSQEIAPTDAVAIMSKVLAKILVGNTPLRRLPEQDNSLQLAIDRFTLQLVHDVNDRLFDGRRQ